MMECVVFSLQLCWKQVMWELTPFPPLPSLLWWCLLCWKPVVVKALKVLMLSDLKCWCFPSTAKGSMNISNYKFKVQVKLWPGKARLTWLKGSGCRFGLTVAWYLWVVEWSTVTRSRSSQVLQLRAFQNLKLISLPKQVCLVTDTDTPTTICLRYTCTRGIIMAGNSCLVQPSKICHCGNTRGKATTKVLWRVSYLNEICRLVEEKSSTMLSCKIQKKDLLMYPQPTFIPV